MAPRGEMDIHRSSVRDDVRTVLTLARWRGRNVRRSIVHEVRDTLPGKIFVVFVLLATPTFIAMIRNGFGEVPAERSALGGYLVLVHWIFPLMAASYATMLFAKLFVVQAENDPLRSHPALGPALARQHVVFILGTILELTLLAYLFFGKALVSAFERPVVGLTVHALTSTLTIVILTAVAVGLTRRWLARRPAAGRTWYVASGIAGLAVMAGLMGIPVGLAESAPAALAAIGGAAERAYYLGALPLLAAHAADAGRWSLPLLTILGLGALAIPPVRHVRAWSVLAPAEFPIDSLAPPRPRFSSLFGVEPRSGRRRLVRAFWLKDVIARATRERHGAAYILEQTGVLWIGVTIVVAAGILGRDGIIDTTWATAVAYGSLVYTGGVLAFVRGLNWLGEEGDHIGLLRPVMTGGRLLVVKGTANALYVVGHALVHGTLLFVTARAIGLVEIGLPSFIAHGAALALLLLGATLTLGFLLPDPRRRSGFLPGASAAGKYLFGGVALVTLSGVLVARVLIAPRATPLAYVGFAAGITAPLAALFAALLVWALHRFHRLET